MRPRRGAERAGDALGRGARLGAETPPAGQPPAARPHLAAPAGAHLSLNGAGRGGCLGLRLGPAPFGTYRSLSTHLGLRRIGDFVKNVQCVITIY